MNKKKEEANEQHNDGTISDIQTVQVKKVMEIGGWNAPLEESFYRISDVEVDKWGNIYVADMGNIRIQKFSPEGKYLLSIGKRGQGPGELGAIFYIEIDSNGFIYVADINNARIQKFSQSGEYVTSLKTTIYDFNDFEIFDDKIFFRKSTFENYMLFETTLDLNSIKPIIPIKPAIASDFTKVSGTSVSFTVTTDLHFIFFNNETRNFYILNYKGNLIEKHNIYFGKLNKLVKKKDLRFKETEKKGKGKVKIRMIGRPLIFPTISFFNGNIFAMYQNITEKNDKKNQSILYEIDESGNFLREYFGFGKSYQTFTLDKNSNIYAIDFDEAKVIKFMY